jgi:hypothetical protein
MTKHDHYKRDVSHLKSIDVYRVIDLFGITCPVAQHVLKKSMAAGKRGHKDVRKDWQDIRDSAERKLLMLEEDARSEETPEESIEFRDYSRQRKAAIWTDPFADWNEWACGEENPAGERVVEVEFRSGEIGVALASVLSWRTQGNSSDIRRWRYKNA